MSVRVDVGLGVRNPALARAGGAVVAGLLCLAAVPARAAPEPEPDCIVFARNKGASLWINGQRERVSENGQRVANCASARFADPSVRVVYVTAPDEPTPRGYNSVDADKDLLVGKRVNLAAPINRFIEFEPSKSVPAGTYAGVLSIFAADNGTQVVAVDVLRPASGGRREAPRLLSIRPDQKGAEPTPLEPLGQSCLDDSQHIVSCDTATPSPLLRVSAYRTTLASADTRPGLAYLAGTDRGPNTPFAGATFYRMKGLLDTLDETARRGESAPPAAQTPADRFDALVADLAYAKFVADAERAKVVKARLRTEFPDIYRAITESMND